MIEAIIIIEIIALTAYFLTNKKHLPLKREIVRVGNGEKIEFQPYQKFRLLSNSIIRSAIKLNKHVVFIDIVRTNFFHFYNRLFISKH